MRDVELMAAWVDDLRRKLSRELHDLSLEELAWQADPAANSIAVTVWHVCRFLDLLVVRAFHDQPPEAEQWHTGGWREKTGYDPRGLGVRGYGAITGYTLAEAAAVPVLSAAELTTYLDGVAAALIDFLTTLPAGGLELPAPGLGGTATVYQWLRPILQGSFGHVGEIQALKGLYTRAHAHPPGERVLPS